MDKITVSRKKLKMSQHKLAQRSGVPRWRIAILELKYDTPKKEEIVSMNKAITEYRRELK